MVIRWLNAALAIAVVIGGVMAHQAGKEHQRLRTEYERLAKKVGDLPIEDPSKVYVLALETDEKLHFAWRIYLPPNVKLRWQTSDGGRSWSSYRDAREFIARVRFREDENGQLIVFTKRANGSGMFRFENRQVADLLRGRWDEIQVEQLGAGEIVTVEPDEIATLLRLTLSDELKQQANEKLDNNFKKRIQTDLFSIRFGSDDAFQQDTAAANATKRRP